MSKVCCSALKEHKELFPPAFSIHYIDDNLLPTTQKYNNNMLKDLFTKSIGLII